MNISGIQKLTLLDYPGKTACTIFTAGCNFRCPFCHNAPLVTEIDANERIDETEIFDFLEKRKGILDGVCITGGEPLLQQDIEFFIRRIKEMGYFVKLDTNGSFPKRLESLIDKNLIDFAAMDIKNCTDKYSVTTGIKNPDIEAVKESVELLKKGRIDYEFRTTVVKELHSSEDFEKIGKWLRGNSKYFLQQYKISENLVGNPMTPYSEEEMKNLVNTVKIYLPNADTRGV